MAAKPTKKQKRQVQLAIEAMSREPTAEQVRQAHEYLIEHHWITNAEAIGLVRDRLKCPEGAAAKWLKEAESSGAVRFYRPPAPDYIPDEKAVIYNEPDLKYRLDQIAPPVAPSPPTVTAEEPDEVAATPPPDAEAEPAPMGAESPAASPEPNPGGRPTDEGLIVEKARQLLTAANAKKDVPRQLAPFARAIRKWLKVQPSAYRDSKGEVASIETIQDHVRDMFWKFRGKRKK